MTITRAFQDRVAAVAASCEKELPLKGAHLPEEYFYQSLPLCVIDAVYSIGVKYEGVRNVVRRYCKHFGLSEFREPKDQMPSAYEQEPLSHFLGKMRELGTEEFTNHIFQNRQRTSTHNGILKSEAVMRFAATLQEHGVNVLQDVPAKYSDSQLDAELRQIPGQRSGISISYFFMLAGSEDLIKTDRMIGRFLKRCLATEPRPDEAQLLISGACGSLRTSFLDLTPRLLDSLIWNCERERTKGSLSSNKSCG
jgi:hypothetical protein